MLKEVMDHLGVLVSSYCKLQDRNWDHHVELIFSWLVIT